MATQPTETDAKEQKQPKQTRKIVLATTISTLAVLVIVYAAGAIYWQDKYYPGTLAHGQDISGETLTQATSTLENIDEEQGITITDERNDSTEFISYQQLGTKINYTNSLQDAMDNHSSLSWPINLVTQSGDKITITVNTSQTELEKSITNSDTYNKEREDSVNAHLGFVDDNYEIVPETYGTTIDKEKLVNTIKDIVTSDTANEISLEENNIYVDPTITSTSEQLEKALEQAKQYVNSPVTLEIRGDEIEFDSKLIAECVTVNDDGTVELDETPIKEKLAEIGKQYDTSGITREFNSRASGTITVSGGDYGWVTDEATMLESIINNIKSGSPTVLQASWKQQGFSETSDIGDTYIELSISQQHVWYVKDGVVDYEFDVVTGKPDGTHDTKKGVWYIKEKATNYKMTGADENGDGQPDYVTYAKTWLRVTWSGTGFHNLYHPYYGGTRYLTNGSHGCINCPQTQVDYLYNNVAIGTPVIIY